ncbi:MAG TPA: FUSC family protein [Solirubrobacteraceae bacterium]|jgi:uncharacterized membrane protein YgaE (UPF0421/DUF939 family)|nr:FUSC family protein [Solirubrobacteraceae bacterium]
MRPLHSAEGIGERVIERIPHAAWPVAQTTAAAGLAWLVAHRVLGHPQPFFAPIAAAVSLGTTDLRRTHRVVQMVIGVLLGIGVGEAVYSIAGAGALPIALAVAATMLLAVVVAAGADLLADGMMFVNQAAASAIIVVALHRQGTGSERVVDALVGGAMALLFATLLFPADPERLVARSRRALLLALCETLARTAADLEGTRSADREWTINTGERIHARLGELHAACERAREIVHIAPRRFNVRAPVLAGCARARRLDAVADRVLGLMRAAPEALAEGTLFSPSLTDALCTLAGALSSAAAGGEAAAIEQARRTQALPNMRPGSAEAVVAHLTRACARELLDALGVGG